MKENNLDIKNNNDYRNINKKDEDEKEEEENDEDNEYLDDIDFNEKLKNYFFSNNGNLKKRKANLNELDEVEKYYKNLMENNWSIKDIEYCQNKYIKLVITPEIKKLRKEEGEVVKIRINKLKNISKNLKK